MRLFKIEGIPNPEAKVYSKIVARSPVMKDFYREVAEEVSSKVSLEKILDIGTGPGYVPLEIARRSQNLEIKAVDVSPAMVRIARKNAEDAGLAGRVQFQYGSAESIPFGNGYFDLIISTISFHHWARPKECLKEIHRVLKNSGEAWIYDLRRDPTKEARSQLRNRYGKFLSFLVLYFVRPHSSVRLRDFQEVISLSGIGFSENNIEDRGIILKLRLLK
jgi:ubiquinone/menaquinone biosynthesis C-methylase UbiE